MLCDGCNVREGHEHRCHSDSGQKDMMVKGERVWATCGCEECAEVRRLFPR